jgi:hypothetical protein
MGRILINTLCGQLKVAIEAQLQGGSTKDVDILHWMTRTALELIGQGGLGYSFDSLIAHTPNEFGEALKQLL